MKLQPVSPICCSNLTLARFTDCCASYRRPRQAAFCDPDCPPEKLFVTSVLFRYRLDFKGLLRRIRDKSSLVGSLPLWLMPIIAVALLMGASSYLNEAAQLSQAETLLLESQPRAAFESFSETLHTPWHQDRARAGIVLSSFLMGQPPPLSEEEISALPSEVLSSASGQLLLYKALSQGEFQLCHELAHFFEERYPGKDLALYRIAAAVELGQNDGLYEDWQSIPSDLRSTSLGNRIGTILESLSAAPLCMVYDRRGTPLGQFREGKGFDLLPSIDARLVPLSTLQQMNLPSFGRSIRLGLDLELSRIARKALSYYRGSIVIVNPRTGEVLCAVSDDRSLRREDSPALNQLLEPASISKLITTTAGLRHGIDVDREISHMTCRGAKRYGDHYLYCAYRAGPLKGLNRAMAISCNIAFAEVGVHVGRQGILEELNRFGFNSDPRLPVVMGRTLQPAGDNRQLADMSIGLEATAITPLHAALIASTFANNGIRPLPQLVSARDGLLGLSPQLIDFPAGNRVLEQAWLPALLDSMRSVVLQGGTAYGVEPKNLQVAMKTGTAATPMRGYHTNYIGFAPLKDPKLAFCVRITNQGTSSRVRYASRVVTKRLLNSLANYLENLPDTELIEFTSPDEIAVDAAEFAESRRPFIESNARPREGG